MNRWYIVIKIKFCYTIYTNRLDITCSIKRSAGARTEALTKSILCVKIKYAPRLPLMMRCSPKEVVKMGSKKRLNKRKTGYKIYQAIEKSGLTYEEVAEELGLSSPRVIYEWTNGNKLPSLVRLVNLSALLNVQMEGLLEIE